MLSIPANNRRMIPLFLYRPIQMRSCLVAVVASWVLFFTGCSSDADLASGSPQAQVARGVEYLRVFNFSSAYKVLSQVQPELDQSSDDWSLATYSLALSAWHKSPPSPAAVEEAKVLLEAVVANDPDSTWTASALLDLGRMAEVADFLGDTTDVAAARSYYRQVLQDFPDTEMSARATAFLAQSMAQSFEPLEVASAIELLAAEIEAQPDSPWVGVLAQYTAQLYAFYLDDVEAALPFYHIAMEVGFPRSADADVSLWQFGRLSEEAGEDLMAAEIFTRLVEQYPRSTYGTIARDRIIEIARTHPQAEIVMPELQGIRLGR